jgi:hypothetical protein
VATYTLQRASSGFIPLAPKGGGVYTIGFPVTSDQNLVAPYTPAAGDVIVLGYVPKGFLLLQGWIDGGMSGTASSTWHFGDTGPSSRISGATDIVVSGMASRQYFLRGTPAVFYGSSILPDLARATKILLTMTCNAVSGSGTFRAGIGLSGTMDYQGTLLTPAGGSGIQIGTSEAHF